jgi:hypothetical protein
LVAVLILVVVLVIALTRNRSRAYSLMFPYAVSNTAVNAEVKEEEVYHGFSTGGEYWEFKVINLQTYLKNNVLGRVPTRIKYIQYRRDDQGVFEGFVDGEFEVTNFQRPLSLRFQDWEILFKRTQYLIVSAPIGGVEDGPSIIYTFPKVDFDFTVWNDRPSVTLFTIPSVYSQPIGMGVVTRPTSSETVSEELFTINPSEGKLTLEPAESGVSSFLHSLVTSGRTSTDDPAVVALNASMAPTSKADAAAFIIQGDTNIRKPQYIASEGVLMLMPRPNTQTWSLNFLSGQTYTGFATRLVNRDVPSNIGLSMKFKGTYPHMKAVV